MTFNAREVSPAGIGVGLKKGEGRGVVGSDYPEKDFLQGQGATQGRRQKGKRRDLFPNDLMRRELPGGREEAETHYAEKRLGGRRVASLDKNVMEWLEVPLRWCSR